MNQLIALGCVVICLALIAIVPTIQSDFWGVDMTIQSQETIQLIQWAMIIFAVAFMGIMGSLWTLKGF